MSTSYLQEDLSFLLKLQKENIFLHTDGDSLICDAAPDSVTESIRAYITENKDRLLALLKSMEQTETLPQIIPDPEQRYEPFPLTENQEAYWLGRNEQLESGGVGIHVYFEMQFENFDKPRFEKAWNEVVRSHAMLRAVLLPEGKQKVLAETAPVLIEEEFLSSTADNAPILTEAREKISHTQYELFNWPQFKMKVFHLPEEKKTPRQSVLMASVDMWCLDLRSLQVLLDHVADLYLGHEPKDIPEPGFRDYLITLQKLHKTPAYERALSYWKDRIQTLPAAPKLPTRPQSEIQTGHFTRRSHRFPKEQWQRIRTILRKKGLTTASVLLACYASTISRWSETKRFTLNIPRYNRLPLHEDINDIVGEFASFSLLEVDNTISIPFEKLAKKIQQQMWEDLEFSHVSGVRVLREWKKTLDATPAVMAPFVFTSEPEVSASHSSSENEADMPTKSLSWIGALERIGTVQHIVTQTPQVWLDSQFSEIHGDLYVSWDSLDGLFIEGLPERMFDTYCNLIASLAEDTSWSESEIALSEKEEALRQVLSGQQEAFSENTPLEMLHYHAQNTPQAIALVDTQGTLSWDETLTEVNRWSGLLTKSGLGKGSAVAFALPKSRKHFILSMAIHSIGGIIVPVDHESPLARIQSILTSSQAAALFTDSVAYSNLCEASCPVINMDAREALPLLANHSRHSDAQLYCMIYTSGSTGTPKGVMIPLKGILNMVQDTAKRFNLDNQDTILALNPIYHDIAIFDIVGTAIMGSTLVFPDPDRLKDPGDWLERIQQWNVTVWDTVPATMTMLLDYLEGSQEADKTLPSLRYAYLGGDWIPLDTPKRLMKIAPEATVVSVGGPTEISVWNILYPVDNFDKNWRSIPYGYPIRNSTYHILDDRLEDCPAMVVGEMFCSGIGLTKGYMGDKEKTQKAFFIHPTKNIPMFRTGDLGRLHPNGYIEFIGRRDNQIKINGYRIELGEIETAMGRHPSVSQSVAIVKREKDSVDGLILWVTLTPGDPSTAGELQAYLKQHVPKYMFPSAIGIAESFPLTQNNKVDRKAIAEWAPPAQKALLPKELPNTPTEILIENTWKELLGITEASLDQNFFEIGGNSIAAVRLYNTIIAGKYSGMSVASIFSFPTIRSLAAAIDSAPRINAGLEDTPVQPQSSSASSDKPVLVTSVTWPSLTPAPVRLPMVPATRVQQRMFYEEHRQQNSCYNMCLHIEINAESEQALDAGKIEEAFNKVVAHQEILRTNFQEVSAANDVDSRHVMQQISPERHIPLQQHDLSEESNFQQAVGQFSKDFTRRAFNLEKDSLVRIALLTETPSRGQLLIGFHHIVLDGWSMTLLLQELTAALNGTELITAPLQQADLALWENSQSFKEACEELLPYAAQRIPSDGTPTNVTTPTWPSANEAADTEECFVEEYIPQHIIDKIAKLGEQNGSTPFAIMCTVFGFLTATYNCSKTAQFGTYTAVRALPGLENILGSMTCPAPLVMQFDLDNSVVETARDTMKQLSESIDVSLIPFDELVREIAPVRQGDELPLFGTAFTFDNTPAQAVTASGMEFRPLGTRQYSTSIDLEAAVSVDSVGTRVMMVFNNQKLAYHPVRDFMQRFIHLLAQVAENPTVPLRELSMLTAHDQKVHNEQHMPTEMLSEKQSILEYFYEVEEKSPDFIALTEVRLESGKPQATTACTLTELRLLADSMTVALTDKGILPGQRIALFMPRSIHMVAAMLAAQQCGAVFTLLPLTMAEDRIRNILNISDSELVCSSRATQLPASISEKDVLYLEDVQLLSKSEQLSFQQSGRVFSPQLDTDVCLFFTSGSEGLPKGVRLTHRNWINRLESDWHSLPYAEGEACISKAITGFIDTFCEIFQPMLKKIPVYMLPEAEESDVEAIVAHLKQWNISRAMIVVSLMQNILEVLIMNRMQLPSLRHVMSSGERLPAGLVEEFYKQLPDSTIHNYYGSTEVAADVVSGAIKPIKDAGQSLVIPLGRPKLNCRIEVMSPARTPLPHGMLGEIAISGPSVTPGYVNGDESSFFNYDGIRFFAPGDMGMWTEKDELLGLGRRDRQVKIRGQRVEPGDVEQVLRRHPQVMQAAVFVTGTGSEMKLLACVVMESHGCIEMDSLRQELRRTLSGAMLPSHFFEVDSIPQTQSGKIDVLALQDFARTQLSSQSTLENDLKTETEKSMATIWEGLLDHPLPSRHADFFTCGGHSLLAIRLIALIRKHFQVALKVRDVFDTPVFSDMSELVELLSVHTSKPEQDTLEQVEVL